MGNISYKDLSVYALKGANSDITSVSGITGGISTPLFVQFNITDSNTFATGKAYWNADMSCIDVCSDVTNVVFHLGQQLVKKVVNKTGGTLLKGSVGYIDGAQGNRPKVVLAKADSEITSRDTLGFIMADIANNAEGYLVTFGMLDGINTSGYSIGDTLFLSATVAGGWTAIPPEAPNHAVVIGKVIISHATQGSICVHIDNGFETTELHDVSGTPNTTGQVLIWNETNGYYAPGIIDATNINIFTDEPLQDFIEEVTPNGRLTAFTLTNPSGLNIAWTSGEEDFVDGSILNINSGSTTVTANAVTYLYSTFAGGSTLQVSTTPPTGEFAHIAEIYANTSDIIFMHEHPLLKHLAEALDDNLELLHSGLVVSGLEVSVDTDATNANDFKVSTGTYFINAHTLERLTSIFYSAGSNHIQNLIERYFHSSGSWTDETSNGVDFGYWDNGTNKTAVTAAKWYSASLIWERTGDGTGRVEYVYPQVQHNTEALALSEAFTYPPSHSGATIQLASFIFKGGQTAFGTSAYFVDKRKTHATGSGGAVAINTFNIISSDSGSTTADSSNDTLTIAGGSLIDTSISGDTVTIAVESSLNTGLKKGKFVCTIDGGGSAISTGAKKIYFSAEHAGTITGWRILADQSGSITLDLWKDTFANRPPTDADTITASAQPLISGATGAQSTTLTGWTTSITTGDIIEVNVDSCSTITKIVFELYYNITGT